MGSLPGWKTKIQHAVWSSQKKKKLCILMITQGSVTFIKICAEKIHDSFRTVVSSGQGERTAEQCVRITLAVLCFFR